MNTDQARELLASRGFGVLATSSKKVPGYPFASIVTFTIDAAGLPIFLLSRLALHTTNLLANPKASLLVFAAGAEQDPLNSARVNCFGEVALVPETEVSELRLVFLAGHPDAAQWIDFGDFALYRMSISEAYHVGGFGIMGWIAGASLRK